MIAFCSSMDQAGPFARDAFGCAALLDAMASYDAKDSTSAQRDKVSRSSEMISQFKIGVLKGIDQLGISEDVLKAYDNSKSVLEKLDIRLLNLIFLNSLLNLLLLCHRSSRMLLKPLSF